MQSWGDWSCDVQWPGPKIGVSGTETTAAAELRPGGTSPRCEAVSVMDRRGILNLSKLPLVITVLVIFSRRIIGLPKKRPLQL